MIGIDTTALIDLYKKDSGLIKILSSLTEHISTTVINSLEIKFGLDPKRKDYEIEKEFYTRLINNLIILDLNLECVEKSSDIFWKLSEKGVTIGKFDCMIAEVLLSNGVSTIITKNKKHFENIKGLKVLSY